MKTVSFSCDAKKKHLLSHNPRIYVACASATNAHVRYVAAAYTWQNRTVGRNHMCFVWADIKFVFISYLHTQKLTYEFPCMCACVCVWMFVCSRVCVNASGWSSLQMPIVQQMCVVVCAFFAFYGNMLIVSLQIN